MADPRPPSVVPLPQIKDLGFAAMSHWPPHQALTLSAERRFREYEETFSFPLLDIKS